MLKKTVSTLVLAAFCAAPLVASAQHPVPNGQHYVHHQQWRRGYHMAPNDWNRGQRIDYRTYHLNAPRPGYEWREVDGNFVEAAIATGVIASVVAASTR